MAAHFLRVLCSHASRRGAGACVGCLRGARARDAYVGCGRGDAGTGIVIQIVNRSVTHWKQCVRLHLIDPGIG